MTLPSASSASWNSVESLPSQLLQRLETWGSYEQTAQKRDLSKLAGIQQLLADLNHPERSYQVIHVAGTNGKGMTTVCLAALLKQDGWRTGAYLSPHLVDLRERVLVDGHWIAPDAFQAAAERVLAVAESYHGDPYLSYFDLMTALALVAFAEAGVEWVVLETGLGGQADSTNAVESKALCLLTSIGFDHEAVLGPTLEDIRREKFGIFRSQVPAVLGQGVPHEEAFFHHRQIPLRTVSATLQDSTHWLTQQASDAQTGAEAAQQNRLAAWLAMDQLFPDATDSQRMQWVQRLQGLTLPGRLQHLHAVSSQGTVWETLLLDGGHNEQALEALRKAVHLLPEPAARGLVLGLAADKVTDRTLAGLKRLVAQIPYVWTVPIPSPRTADPQVLAEQLQARGVPAVEACASWEEAFEAAGRRPLKHLVLAGSFYLIGAFLRTHPEWVQTQVY